MKRWMFGWVMLVLIPLSAMGQASVHEPLIRGDSLWQHGALKGAIRAYEAGLERDETAPDAHIRLAQLWITERRWNKAANHAKAVLKQAPQHQEARYYQAIILREQGRQRLPLAKVIDFLRLDELGLIEPYRKFERAAQLFEDLIAEDSTLLNVLYEYAQLQQYQRRHLEALALAHAQVRQRPESPEAHLGLLRIYKRFITHAPQEAKAWLETSDNPYATYFKGESLRRAKDYRAAEAAYIQLVSEPRGVPLAPVYQALARVYAALDVSPRIVEAQVWNAINAIASPVDAALVLEDVKYILSDAEWFAYQSCKTAADFQHFFRQVWTKRDPLPASRSNMRIAGHYQRLLYAEDQFAYDGPREAWRSQQKTGKPLDYPAVYRLNDAFNDKGLIYLRHGNPSDRVASLAEHLSPNESWLYRATASQPEFIFHFLSSGGGYWQLVPALLHPDMLSDRAHWGHPFLQYNERQGRDLLSASVDEQIEAMRAVPSASEEAQRFLALEAAGGVASEMQRMSQDAVDMAFTSDRHVWNASTKPLPLASTLATFRGENGQTRVDVLYAFSMASLAQHVPSTTTEVDVDLGLILQNMALEPVAQQRDRKRITVTQKATDGILNGFSVQVPPDRYRIAFHIQPRKTDVIGALALPHNVPDYTLPHLMVSDLVLALQVNESTDSSLFSHGNLRVVPNPSYRFRTNQPVYTYVEAYNLTFGANDETHYTIEYTITAAKERRGLLRRRARPSLSLKTSYNGSEAHLPIYNEIDVTSVEPGDYTFTVTLTDAHTGATVSATRPLVLY